MIVRVSAFLLALSVAQAAESAAPPFFLQDPTDSLCLSGETFTRCSIDTLFYVEGSPGKYQIHKRDESNNSELCIAKKNCKDSKKMEPARLALCSHCGAQDWNVLGDADTGYVLSHKDGETCLIRQGNQAMTAPCDSADVNFVPLQLQFASAADVEAMGSPGARLVGAAHDGDKKAIQALLKDGVDIMTRDWDGLTALIPAASSGNLDLCKYLVKEGIDVNAADNSGITALMEASLLGHVKVVEFLLEQAEVDAQTKSGVTALWLAASEGKADVMKILLKKGADPSVARVDGITALMSASVGGHANAIEVLVDAGADPTVTDGEGLTPLMNAAENGTVAVLKLLAEKADSPDYLDAVSTSGFTALIIASAHGHTDAVKYLLEAGAGVDVAADTVVTALMYAAASNNLDVVKVLVEQGKADIEKQHTNGGTALLEASTGGSFDALKYLVEKGAQYKIVDNDGVSPFMAVASQGSLESLDYLLDLLKKDLSDAELVDYINMLSFSGGSSAMFAAAGGHANCTERLISLGADVNKIAKATPEYLEKLEADIAAGVNQNDEPHVDGVTGLHVAAQRGHLEVVDLLLAAGADPTIKDEEDRTPLLLAIKGNYGEVASSLVKAGADPNTPYVDDNGDSHNLLFDAIMVENDEFAKLLIEKGADIYFADEKKVNTLLQASHRGLKDVVEALLNSHAASGKKSGYVDEASDEGVTPLIASASEGHPEITKLLIAAKANINVKDSDGTSALMAASARGHVDVVKALLEAGANINDQNADGHTALMFAYNGKNQVMTLWERYSQFLSENGDSSVDDGGTGPIIREALDQHTALVELLMKSGADAKLKDKEGHTAADFDFHPDADAKVLEKEAKAKKMRDESKNEL